MLNIVFLLMSYFQWQETADKKIVKSFYKFVCFCMLIDYHSKKMYM